MRLFYFKVFLFDVSHLIFDAQGLYLAFAKDLPLTLHVIHKCLFDLKVSLFDVT